MVVDNNLNMADSGDKVTEKESDQKPMEIDMEMSVSDGSGDDDEVNEHATTGALDGSGKVETPKMGMMFSSKEEVYQYYASYARKEGFAVLKRSSKNGDDGQLRYITLTCARTGKPVYTPVKCFRPQPTRKTECKAKINAVLCPDGRYAISRVALEHNHELTPGNVRFFPRGKNMDSYVGRRAELTVQAGTNMSKNLDSFVVETGGQDNLQFTEKDCQNVTETFRHLKLGPGGAEAIFKYFSKMQDKNSSFYHVMDLDDEGHLRNVFWADARSRAAYESFGDVVLLDTTYLTNKFEMPFAPFVGVNHHGQSILLGCSLLSNGDTEKTYIWLFQSWLACMSWQPPKTIITDQCKAIQGAVAKVFPESRHRLCLWHIMEKIPKKLRGCSRYELIKNTLHNVVYDSSTSTEFEEHWKEMIATYELENNDWLHKLYNDRHHWVPVYVKDIFCAGIPITDRSESVNPFFGGYVNLRTTLRQFVEQYDNALRSKVEKENQADFASLDSKIPLITHLDIEKQFQEVYTTAKFREFQDELRGLIYCNVAFVKEDCSILTYEVEDNIKIGDVRKDVVFNVYYNDKECEVNCLCCLFEFRGILCRHAIAVLNKNKVEKVPSRYILSRWRKDLKHRYTFIKCSYTNVETNDQVQRYEMLCNYFYQIAEVGAYSEEKCTLLMSHLHDAKENMQNNKSTGSRQPTQVKFPSLQSCNEELHGVSGATSSVVDPFPVQLDGHPTLKREESDVDQVARKIKASKGRKTQEIDQNKSQKCKRKKDCSKASNVENGKAETKDVIKELGNPNQCWTSYDGKFINPSFIGSQQQGNTSQLWTVSHGGMHLNASNFVENLSQVYPSHYMVVGNQLAPTASQSGPLQGKPVMPTTANDGGSLPP